MNFKMRDGEMKTRMDISLYNTMEDLQIIHKLSNGQEPHRFLEGIFRKLIDDQKTPKETPKEETPKETPKKGRLLKKTTN